MESSYAEALALHGIHRAWQEHSTTNGKQVVILDEDGKKIVAAIYDCLREYGWHPV